MILEGLCIYLPGMKSKLIHISRQWPVFLLLLPLFYLLHQANENFAPGLIDVVLIQAILYTGIGVVITLIFYLPLRNFKRAALVSFFVMSFNFFFGTMHDLAKEIIGRNSFLLKYTFIMAVVLLLLILITIGLKRSKREFGKTFAFLNVLFSVLTILEIATLIPKSMKMKSAVARASVSEFVTCDSCPRPDVYVIIADEYAGKQELNDIFSFDNSAFEKELQERGFHIVSNTTSNYNATVYSMASLFNMSYISLRGKKLVTQGDMLLCRSIINRNNVSAFFQQQGYAFHNFSFFNLQGKEKALTNFYFHPKSRILLFGTFLNRFRMEAGFNFFSKKRARAIEQNDFINDEKADSLTRELVLKKVREPKFVYTHFTRPHHPYYLDRNGLPFSHQDSLKGFDLIKKEYTEHLLYTNKRLLQLIDHIQKNSSKPPVILLASDHGFRQFYEEADKKYYFMNLCAISLPGKRYESFYDGMTTVNIFRSILNAQFGQKLPLLKDSTVFLTEKALW